MHILIHSFMDPFIHIVSQLYKCSTCRERECVCVWGCEEFDDWFGFGMISYAPMAASV